ncbi:HAD family hydrolase [Paenibacillus sp. M1]|uniref:HAD family hydrolase n=1 Tax=Paenibacillus haidiansis TaxID=1574488 RepID=A0ABU7VST0_9BACL
MDQTEIFPNENVVKGIRAICCDCYDTLIELNQPFEQIRKFITDHLDTFYPNVSSSAFFGKFLRFRAVLSSELEFRRGIDLLEESIIKTCISFEVSDFSGPFKMYVERLFVSCKAYPDVHKFIENMRKFYKLGLLTNADNDLLSQTIIKNGLNMDFVITSEDARSNKPSRRIFDYAMEKLDLTPAQILMIGDSQTDDLMGAGRLGIPTAWINRRGESLKPEIPAPLFEVRSLSELMLLLVQ